MNVADFLLQRFVDWGVHRIYGFPGDGINGILGALDRRARSDGKAPGGGLEFVQARHEEMAAFMACAHAKFTGEVGVCLATSGPGAIHLLNGLYDARMDHAPVVAIVGQSARAALGGSYQQEVDLNTLFKDVAGDYVHTLVVPEQARHLVDRAVRIALAERTVTCIIVPNDVQSVEAEEPARKHNTIHSSLAPSPMRIVPSDTELDAAASVLNDGSKPAILVGQGARDAAAEIEAMAEVLGAGVAKALLGKDVLPDDLPYVTGAIGLLGTRPSWDLMMEADTLLMVGTSFPYSEFLPKEGQARGVQIDRDPRMIGIRYPTEVNLVGDSRETLRALLPRIRPRVDRSWRDRIEGKVAAWWREVEAESRVSADPINPQLVFRELSSRLPDGAILAADSGTSADWYARDVRLRRGMRASLSGNLATMGPGVPYAIAAKFAYPDRVAIAMVGDGAMQMNGINGLITISKYWRRWSDPRLVVLVLHNNDLNQVTWEQRVMEGDPKYEASQDVPDFPYASYAESLGLAGTRVDRPEDIGAAWEAAFASDRPFVLEALTDPNVPPLPPHISLEQARNLTSSLVSGDRDLAGVIAQSVKGVATEIIR